MDPRSRTRVPADCKYGRKGESVPVLGYIFAAFPANFPLFNGVSLRCLQIRSLVTKPLLSTGPLLRLQGVSAYSHICRQPGLSIKIANMIFISEPFICIFGRRSGKRV